MHATYIDVIIALLYADYAAGVVKSGACRRTQWRHILHVTLPPLPLAAWPATANSDGRRCSTPNVPPRHGTANSCRHSLRRHVPCFGGAAATENVVFFVNCTHM
jgi:hypothetical protein